MLPSDDLPARPALERQGNGWAARLRTAFRAGAATGLAPPRQKPTDAV